MAKLFWPIAVVFCAVPGGAVAGAGHVNSVWVVEPSVATTGPRLLAPSEMLVTTRLIPPTLAVLNEAVVDPNNSNYPIAVGTQLFGTLDGSIWNPKEPKFPVFCEFIGFVAEPGKRLRGDLTARRCLVDHDADGAFDGIFTTVSCLAEFPTIANFDLPKTMASISARYRRVAPQDITGGPRVGIVFDGFNYMNGGPRFFRAFGNGKSIPAMGRLSQKKTKDGLHELFGATFAIGESDAGRVSAELKQAIPAQPFAMLGGGMCLG